MAWAVYTMIEIYQAVYNIMQFHLKIGKYKLRNKLLMIF